MFFSAVDSATYFDNLQIVPIGAIPHTPASATTLPFRTGVGDLTFRDGLRQHPNIDLLGGSLRYLEEFQRDGTLGKVLSLGVSEGAVELVGPGAQGDFRLEFDFQAIGGQSHFVYFRA